jgi:MFS family permease
MEQRTKHRIALSALFFQSGLCFSTWASRIPDIKGTFALSDSELGLLLLIRPVGSFIGLPLAGWVVDNHGSRLSVITGLTGLSLSLVFVSLAPTVWWLLPCLLFFGISSNLANVSINTEALVVQKSFDRFIISSFHGLWSLAGFTGAVIGAIALNLNMGMLYHVLLVSATILIMLTLSVGHISKKPQGSGAKKFALKIPDKHLLSLGIIAFFGLICEGCMFDWSGVYFKQVVQAEEGLIAIGYMAFMGTMALGRFVSGYFTNRFGSTRVVQASGALICTGLMVAVFFPYLTTAILGFFLVGAGTSSVIPLTYAQVGNSKHISPGIALAMVSTIGYIGFLMGPPLIGFIADLLSLRASFALVALVGLCISITVTLASRLKKEETA